MITICFPMPCSFRPDSPPRGTHSSYELQVPLRAVRSEYCTCLVAFQGRWRGVIAPATSMDPKLLDLLRHFTLTPLFFTHLHDRRRETFRYFVMTVLPSTWRVDVKRLQDALEVRDVRLATEVEIANLFPDCQVGTMPPFGNLYGVEVYVDQLLTEDESIVFEAGTYVGAMRLRIRTLLILCAQRSPHFITSRRRSRTSRRGSCGIA